MKLVKMINQLDTINQCELFDVDKDKCVWSGETFLLECAINASDESREQFFRDCVADEDFERIELVKKAMSFRDYELVCNDDGESVLFFPFINERNVPLLKIQFNVRKRRKKNDKR